MMNRNSSSTGVYRSPWLIVSATCFAAAAATIVAARLDPRGELSTRPGAATLLVALLFVCLAIASHFWFRPTVTTNHVRNSILHPPVQMVWYALLMFAIPGWYGVLNPRLIRPLLLHTQFDYRFVAWGLLVVLVGSAMVCIGYGAGMKILAPFGWARQLGQGSIRFRAVLVAYVAILLVQLLSLATGRIAYADDVASEGPGIFAAGISYITGAMPLVLALMVIGVVKTGWPKGVVLVAWVAQFGLVFVSGFSKPMLNLLLVLFLASILAGIQIRRLMPLGIIAALLALLIVPIAEGLRQQLFDGTFDGSVESSMAAVIVAYKESWGQGLDVGWEVFIDKLMRRQAQSAMSPGVIMSLTPGVVPFQGVGNLLAIPTLLVPRVVWPDKPIVTSGRWLSSTYFGYDESTVNSSAATIYGHLYTFDGWVTVLLGSIALGVLLAMVVKNTLNVGLGAVLVALVPVYIHVGADFVSGVLSIVQQTVVLVFVYWGINQLSRKHRL